MRSARAHATLTVSLPATRGASSTRRASHGNPPGRWATPGQPSQHRRQPRRLSRPRASIGRGSSPTPRSSVLTTPRGRRRLHVMGLCSDRRPLDARARLFAVIDFASAAACRRSRTFIDGRDTPPGAPRRTFARSPPHRSPRSGPPLRWMRPAWDRVEKAWRAIVNERTRDAATALDAAYAARALVRTPTIEATGVDGRVRRRRGRLHEFPRRPCAPDDACVRQTISTAFRAKAGDRASRLRVHDRVRSHLRPARRVSAAGPAPYARKGRRRGEPSKLRTAETKSTRTSRTSSTAGAVYPAGARWSRATARSRPTTGARDERAGRDARGRRRAARRRVVLANFATPTWSATGKPNPDRAVGCVVLPERIAAAGA